MERQNTRVQKLQEFRSQKNAAEDKQSRPIYRTSSEDFPDRDDDAERHSATPELLNSLNYVRV
jgi:hypothetical protein